MIRLFIFIFSLLISFSANAALEKCYAKGKVCIEGPETRIIEDEEVFKECWKYQREYECIGDIVDSCEGEDLSGWNLEGTQHVEYYQNNPNNPAVKWDDVYTQNERWELVCDSYITNLFCGGNPNCDLSQFDCSIKTPEQCVLSGSNDPNGDGVTINRNCWQKDTLWSCFTNKDTSCNKDISECNWSGFTCMQEDPEKDLDPTYGHCVNWQDRYICPDDTIVSCDGNTGLGCGSSLNHKIIEEQDGQAVQWTDVYKCYTGELENCNTDPDCQMISVECEYYDNDGICEKMVQTYKCGTDTKVCVVEKTETVCGDTIKDYGTANISYTPAQTFGAAAQAMGTMEAVDEGAYFDLNGNLRIFKGESRSCKKVTQTGKNMAAAVGIIVSQITIGAPGFLGAAYISQMDLDCCHDEVEEIDMDEGMCKEEHLKLAAAREAKRATKVRGTYAKETIDVGFDEYDIIVGQDWCAFDSQFGRIIHEQGRAQLNDLAANSATGSQLSSYDIGLFSDSNNWGDEIVANGNKIHIWRWDSDCLNPEKFAQGAIDATLNCSMNNDIYFAVCSKADCGSLPTDPRLGAYDSSWSIGYIERHQKGTAAISEYVVAKSSCTDQINTPPDCPQGMAQCMVDSQCKVDFYAWEAGVGGQLHLTTDVTFPMYYLQEDWFPTVFKVGLLEIQGWTYNIYADRNHTDVKLRYRYNSSAWTEVMVPTEIENNSFSLSTTPEAKIFGYCKEDTGCQYRVYLDVSVTAKPWLVNNKPECSGFTMEQFQVLDFERMDLSEFTSQFASAVPPVATSMVPKTEGDVQTLVDAFANGNAVSTNQKTRLIKVDKSNAHGGVEEIKLKIPQVYPLDTETVKGDVSVDSVSIDWGDGNTSTASVVDSFYYGEHLFGAVSANKTYTITVTFNTDYGSYEETVDVLVWKDRPAFDASGSGNSLGGYKETIPYLSPGGADSRVAPDPDTNQ